MQKLGGEVSRGMDCGVEGFRWVGIMDIKNLKINLWITIKYNFFKHVNYVQKIANKFKQNYP